MHMPIEIERKFLLKDDTWRNHINTNGILCKQGYILAEKGKTVRVRVADNNGYVTVKGETAGARRPEYEYSIPVDDAEEMISLFCENRIVEKIRYEITHDTNLWEVDEFLGENTGLVIAEIELEDENQDVHLPEWVGQEVTCDGRFANARLALHPYSMWEQTGTDCKHPPGACR